MASGLIALQACSDERSASEGTEPGGRFTVPSSAATDTAEAETTVHGSTTVPTDSTDDEVEVVVDVQTHFLESGDWGVNFPQGQCGEAEAIDCLSAEYWRDLVLGGSDTAVAIISAVPVVGAADPLSIDAMERGKALAAELCGDDHVLIQGHAVPDVGPLDVALASMADVAAAHRLSAWKVYTHTPGGWYLDDHDPNALQIGSAVPPGGSRHGRADRGRAQGSLRRQPVRARRSTSARPPSANPDIAFLVYHSGYESGVTRGRVRPRRRRRRPAREERRRAGIGPGGNVYAELGSTWRTVMGDPDQAAHVLGKLLVAFGPERILWGTDSIWYGSPQDQIAAFRAFEITPAFQEQFGYPALTPEVKRRILGRNAIDLFGITVPTTHVRAAEAAGFRAHQPHVRSRVTARTSAHLSQNTRVHRT